MSRGARRLVPLDPGVRCYLFYGPDEAGSRSLAGTVATAVGLDADRIDLSPAQLKADPALLADEAAAGSLFGGSRYIRVDGAGDECLAAVEALLTASAAGNPALLVAGALRKDARLVKRVHGDACGIAIASYLPDAADLTRSAIATAADHGLRVDADLARRLVDAASGDRALVAREIEKLADYADASIDAPAVATDAMVDAIGVDRTDADVGGIVDAATAGDVRALEAGLTLLAADGQDGIMLVRAVLRRLIALAAVRAEMDRGATLKLAIDRAAKTLFWRDRETVTRDVGRWPAARLATAIERMAGLERELKSTRGAGPIMLDRLLHTMVRAARR